MRQAPRAGFVIELDGMQPSKTSHGAKFALGCLGAGMVLAVVCVLGLGFFLLTSCSFNKPLVASDLPKPDRAFQTGTVAGYNVYVWECYRDKHIVVYNFTGEMFSGPYKREESACGTVTPIEEEALPQKRRDVDPQRF